MFEDSFSNISKRPRTQNNVLNKNTLIHLIHNTQLFDYIVVPGNYDFYDFIIIYPG